MPKPTTKTWYTQEEIEAYLKSGQAKLDEEEYAKQVKAGKIIEYGPIRPVGTTEGEEKQDGKE